ncbi:DNA-binding transcriptional LysR family regulator [Nocardioides luteus]|uniref:LysR family transcriptional regulator n=1 Tax=Nocardioides luteus TaxID=1844 RepID=A0ABQ5SXM5_9ACTN|nr:LysR family transcriptional regulator [Nocardioides luteus]MDR7312686.1 DNA-binding transcriptional LysR family regulator [Nocardioides luteus]GGR46844.1 LysR family transcriptional regulator [Nocardioides luteus]GLJ68935.1 LysR family transcriptional regulator [Nocardioides luteus]
METRELRYFVAVAEELHFSRAAQRLGIAQPPLSRAISQLERRLGGPLLERNSRGVALTEAGRVLLAEARAAIDAVDAAERRTRRATGDGSEPGLVLVSKAGAASELLTKLLDAYAAEPGAVKVEVDLCGIGEQGPRLRDGRADVALLHRPFDVIDGLDTEELLTEGQVAVLPSSHPFATRSELRMADLEDVPGLPPMSWPGARAQAGAGPEIRDSTQLYQLVGLGRAFTILPESARAEQHHGVATVPVVDAPEVTTVIAWPPHSRSLALAALVRAATRL